MSRSDEELDALLGALGPPDGAEPRTSASQILALLPPPPPPPPKPGIPKWAVGGAVSTALVAGFAGGVLVSRALGLFAEPLVAVDPPVVVAPPAEAPSTPDAPLSPDTPPSADAPATPDLDAVPTGLPDMRDGDPGRALLTDRGAPTASPSGRSGAPVQLPASVPAASPAPRPLATRASDPPRSPRHDAEPASIAAADEAKAPPLADEAKAPPLADDPTPALSADDEALVADDEALVDTDTPEDASAGPLPLDDVPPDDLTLDDLDPAAPIALDGPATRWSLAVDLGSRAFPSAPDEPRRAGISAGVDLRVALGEGERLVPTLAVGLDTGAALEPSVGPPVLSPHAGAELGLRFGNWTPSLGAQVGADWSFTNPRPRRDEPARPTLAPVAGVTLGLDVGRADRVHLRLRGGLDLPLLEAPQPTLSASAGLVIPLGTKG